jgi:diadenosine tetraphosphate (Ap4A) HIT family hydrolase
MEFCTICLKHATAPNLTLIASAHGWKLSHFPFLPDEKAGRGHLLLESVRHVTDPAELNDAEAAGMGRLVRDAVLLLKNRLGAEHVYLFRINDKVPHLHLHLIPRYADTPPEFRGLKILEWPERPALQREEITRLAEELRQAWDDQKRA